MQYSKQLVRGHGRLALVVAIVAAVALSASAVAVAVLPGNTPTPPPTAPTSISVSLGDSTIEVGDTTLALATCSPVGSNQSVTWTSSDPDVASVDRSTGVVTAYELGKVAIMATSVDFTGGSVVGFTMLEVVPTKVTSISTSWDSNDSTYTTIQVGNSEYANINEVLPSDATDGSVTWSSSNTGVASVDYDGEVWGVSSGVATITATADDGSGVKSELFVRVYQGINWAEVVLDDQFYDDWNEWGWSMQDSECPTASVYLNPSNASYDSVWYEIPDYYEVDSYVSINATSGVITPVKDSVTSGYIHFHVQAHLINANGVEDYTVWSDCMYIVPTWVTSIDVTLSDSSIAKSESATATAAVLPSDASNKSVSWWSDDESVATVDSSGKITPHNTGWARIYASATDGSGEEDYEIITVEPTPLTAIDVRWDNSLATTTTVLAQGTSLYAELYTYAPSNADDTSMTWESSDTDVATVDSDGEVHAVGNGTAIITGYSDDGSELSDTVFVEVYTPVDWLDVYEYDGDEWAEIWDSESTTMAVDIYPSDATTQTVTWSWSDEEDGLYASIDPITGAITVNNGALPAGVDYVHIHAKATVVGAGWDGEDVSDWECVEIYRTPVKVTAINVTAAREEIGIGYETTVTASIEPTSATNQDFWWESSDSEIATVDQYGNVHGVSAGTVRIYAYAEDGSEVYGYVDITVSRILSEMVRVTLADSTIPVGTDTTASAVVLPAETTDKSHTWSSSNEKIATIDPVTGEIHGVSAGRVRIVASADDDGLAAGYAYLTVTADSFPESVDVTLDPDTVRVGQGSKASANVMPLDSFSREVTWSSSDESIATVDEDGNITTYASGECTITATGATPLPVGGYSPLRPRTVQGSAKLTVVPALATKIVVSVGKNVVTAGQTTTATAMVMPETALADVEWSTSDALVASIDASGNITALKAGVVNIIATAKDGSEVYDVEQITVNAVPVIVKDVLTVPVLSTSAPKAGVKFTIKSTIGPKYALKSAPAIAVIQKKGTNGKYTTVAGVKLYVTSNSGSVSALTGTAVIKTKGTYRVRTENTATLKVYTAWKSFTVK